MTRMLRIGTRGSALALVQAKWVAARLAGHGVATEITIIRTEGDDRPIDTAWGEGAFVGRIVAALLDGSVDLAVHSAKDVPTDEHPLLAVAAYPPREDPRDALACRVRGTTLATLPRGARVGTDSPRRVAFLRAVRPDLEMHPLHGNVDTRLMKLDRGDSDALVLAVAGLTRLGRADRIDDVLSLDIVASAPGQGSLALQVRADDPEAIEAVGRLDDAATRIAVEAERWLLNGTGGGCRSPIGVVGRAAGDRLELVAAAERTWVPGPGAVIEPDRIGWVRGTAPATDRRELAMRLAARVVTLRERPRALVARPDGQAGPLLAALAAAGVDGVHVPAIEIRQVAAAGELDTAASATAPGETVVVASANGAIAALDALARTGVDPAGLRWAAVGHTTALALRAAGVSGIFVPSVPDAATLAAELPVAPGDRVLVPHGDIADPLLTIALRERGVDVREVVAYSTAEAPEASRALLRAVLDEGPIDVLVLTSRSTVRGLLELGGEAARRGLLATPVVAVGAQTAGAASDAGFRQVLVAPAPDAASLAAYTAAALGVAIAEPGPDSDSDPEPKAAVAPTGEPR
ncbi:MAG TPA: hydroxymethylbilane synthase [Candidatus Limnocylindrales bacterium]|nr:hydroxymethylbilane synthase [Candidatus Limnocylindrales bacterium]